MNKELLVVGGRKFFIYRARMCDVLDVPGWMSRRGGGVGGWKILTII